MNVVLATGSIGQIQGPFNDTDTISFGNTLVKLGVSIDEKDLMSYNDTFIFAIDGQNIKIGKEGTYEATEGAHINNVTFPFAAPASVKVDYVILET